MLNAIFIFFSLPQSEQLKFSVFFVWRAFLLLGQVNFFKLKPFSTFSTEWKASQIMYIEIQSHSFTFHILMCTILNRVSFKFSMLPVATTPKNILEETERKAPWRACKLWMRKSRRRNLIDISIYYLHSIDGMESTWTFRRVSKFNSSFFSSHRLLIRNFWEKFFWEEHRTNTLRLPK